MGKKANIGCSRTSSNDKIEEEQIVEKENIIEGEKQKMIKVGKPAPNFTAPAFYKGEFTDITLEDYKGKWVLLCFYPGDFTFV